MFWTEKKLKARINELGKYRYRETISIPSFYFEIDEKGDIGTRPPQKNQCH